MDDGFEFPRDSQPEPFMCESYIGDYVRNVTDHLLLLRQTYGDTAFLVLHTTAVKDARRCCTISRHIVEPMSCQIRTCCQPDATASILTRSCSCMAPGCDSARES